MNIATIRSTMTEHEAAQVERANASHATPIVFVHGLWLLPLELGPLGDAIRGGWLCGVDTGLARRSRDSRRGQRPP